MATQKPISTISYNSESFLKEKLDAWLKAHIIQCYQYICHKGEEGDKDHIHVRIEPNKRIDPMDLKDELREFVLGNDKPLGVRPFRPSKEEDWFLYVVHDKKYLKMKYGGGEKGEKLEYSWKKIVVPEDYDLEIAFLRAKSKMEHSSGNLADRMKKGDSPLNLILEGENVYTVNAIMHALTKNDYMRLSEQYRDLKIELDHIIKAIDDYGLVLTYDEKGYLQLSKKGDDNFGTEANETKSAEI